MTDLFNIPETLSPRLQWLRKHDVHTFKTPGDDDGNNAWVAWAGEVEPPLCVYGEGDTEADSIASLAKRNGWLLWNEEGATKCP